MTDRIQIGDKHFIPFISEERILEEVTRVAGEINRDLEGLRPLFLCVLNGSFVFAADLLRRVHLPCELSFVKLASYQGDTSTGQVTEVLGLTANIEGRTVVVVEDIIDTGVTMRHLLDTLREKHPREIRVATLLLKPGKLREEVPTDYVALSIPDDFIVGYGLDYDGYGRNLRDIYIIDE